MTYKTVRFESFTNTSLYEVMKLRQDIFIVEQECYYHDLDDLDQISWHIVQRDKNHNIMAYCRIVPPGALFKEPSIGRIIVKPEFRRKNLGRQLIKHAITKCQSQFSDHIIRITAQYHLRSFYEDLGFKTDSDSYDDAGIMHVEMIYLK